MATLLASAPASVHRYPARRLHFSAKGVELLIERQAEQPEPPLDPELEGLLTFLGLRPFFSGLGCAQQSGIWSPTLCTRFQCCREISWTPQSERNKDS